MTDLKVVVGLGNPGKKYEVTRHNMGALVIQGIAHLHGWSFKEDKKLFALTAKGMIGEHSLLLVLPTTYMNDSGRAVRRTLDYYKLGPEHLLVVSDETALPFGEMRLRERGSAGGHNGLKSVQAHLGTSDYARLRMGIGRGRKERALADYVLDNFSKEETDALTQFIQKGASTVEQLLTEEITRMMNDVNIKVESKQVRRTDNDQNKESSLRRDVHHQRDAE